MGGEEGVREHVSRGESQRNAAWKRETVERRKTARKCLSIPENPTLIRAPRTQRSVPAAAAVRPATDGRFICSQGDFSLQDQGKNEVPGMIP